MITMFKNALIIKDFDSEPFYGDIVVNGEVIEYIGSKYEGEYDKLINAQGNIIMPGFVDAHAHSAMEIYKGLGNNDSLSSWLCGLQKMEEKLTSSDVYNASYLSVFEYAKNGITTINDNYHFPDYAAEAFADAGIRAVVGISQRYNMKKFLTNKQYEDLFLKISGMGPLISANFFCHSIYAADEKMFTVAQNLANKYNSFVSTHVSETLEEVGKCASQNNDMSPIELLESYGFFDHKSMAIHCTNVSEQDIMILSNYKASVCANFGSNYKLASGICPIYQMRNSNINICLGTDGNASNNRLDMFREMYLASVSQRNLLSNANLFSSREILKMATINGAKALGLKKVGTLKAGNFADLIMLRAAGIDGLTNYSIFDNLVYSYGTEDVLLTMCDGKVLYDGKHFNLGKSYNSILNKNKQIISKLCK